MEKEDFKKLAEHGTYPRLTRASKGVNKNLSDSYVIPAKETNPSALGKRGARKNH